MSRSKSELSFKEREILQTIIHRTKNPKYPTFFGSNEYLAKCFDIQPDTARKAINKLIKTGYLAKGSDEQNRRHLIYTGKEFTPVVLDLRNIDKHILKQERDDALRELSTCRHELELAQIRIKSLENEAVSLRNKLFESDMRINELENIFFSQGVSKEQIDGMIKQVQTIQAA